MIYIYFYFSQHHSNCDLDCRSRRLLEEWDNKVSLISLHLLSFRTEMLSNSNFITWNIINNNSVFLFYNEWWMKIIICKSEDDPRFRKTNNILFYLKDLVFTAIKKRSLTPVRFLFCLKTSICVYLNANVIRIDAGRFKKWINVFSSESKWNILFLTERCALDSA